MAVDEPSLSLSTSIAQVENSPKSIKNDGKVPKDSLYAEYVTQRGVFAGIFYFSAQDQCFVFRCKGYSYLPKDNIVYQLSTIFHRIDDT